MKFQYKNKRSLVVILILLDYDRVRIAVGMCLTQLRSDHFQLGHYKLIKSVSYFGRVKFEPIFYFSIILVRIGSDVRIISGSNLVLDPTHSGLDRIRFSDLLLPFVLASGSFCFGSSQILSCPLSYHFAF